MTVEAFPAAGDRIPHLPKNDNSARLPDDPTPPRDKKGTKVAFLTRSDPTRNIDRFYLVDVTPTLFGEWGRRGSPGTVRLTSYRCRDEAQIAERHIMKRRLRHGFKVI